MDNYVHTCKDGKEIVPIMEEIIKNGGHCKLRVTGYSMIPILKHLRDSVILTSSRNRPIEKGEIVFIRRNTGQFVLHRVYKIIDDNTFVMNGDAQQWLEVVKNDQVIGVCSKIIRDNREISCDNWKYKSIIKIWQFFRPIRNYIFKINNIMKRIIRTEGK
ncbi:S24/S26 family peptidase [Terrisporobacter petrolearius]|uniref:S24/S26 family peptidase n=1 Tax=Terrisporobacter petrolearius TaxID=1460447 RepID=UPI0022DF1DA2|nr:S24/S26 family peptidase [Terrisporobacter petrolearius]